ncbi:MAG: hypothetical protein A2X08_12535 [Bacteroidetes bacterium GWA2_32_17]|nr:MAG: hypothetical protein A2X08_12535 [Bacteroidetes bacterium GWA2_32_17]
MKKNLLSISLLGFTVIQAFAQTYISGNVSGTWNLAGSPYVIIANDTVPDGQTLVIDAGVTVKFALGVNMYVAGTLTANGNATDSIRLTTAEPSPTPGQWGAINFSSDINRPLSVLQYVILQYGGANYNPVLQSFMNTHLEHSLIEHNATGIILYAGGDESEIALKHCLIRYNDNYGLIGRSLTVYDVEFISNTGLYAGIAGSHTTFRNCLFSQNSPMAYILFDSNTHTSFINCLIENNTAGVGSCYVDDTLNVDSCIIRGNSGPGINGNAIYNKGTLLVTHCVIYNNTGDGITNPDHGSVIERNTIDGNAGGITNIESNSSMILRNNIISNNTGSGFQTVVSTAPQLKFNNVYNNVPDFSGFSVFYGDTTLSTNNNGVPSDLYKNIRRNPWYVNSSSGDYHLQVNSPCIDAGDLTLSDPDGSISDIGAFYFPLPVQVNENNSENTFSLFPNPFSTQTILQTDKVFTNAILTLYNSLGQQVKQIKNISGQTITLFRDNLTSGLYFLRLTQDNKVITTDKLIISD